ncbi:MAG: hypothetical protein WA052_02680 [Microgenomates group bacterium]
MKNKIIKFLPILLLIGIVLAFYWKVFRGYIPFPGDLLVGAYYPWLESKWGYVVGVPVKNTLISDIFSQFFMWKDEIVRSFLNFKWPLWNPYSYSGYPLLANFNSGPLNPFNLIEVILGRVNGWTWLVISQPLGSILSMYWYLKTVKKETLPALIGSVVYALGGFAILWSQFVNADFTMIWIPIVLIVIEKTIEKNNKKYLLWLSPLFFFMVTAGHLQALIYVAILTVCYFVYRAGIKNRKFNIFFALSLILSVCFSAIQLLPTIELMNHSIRFDDGSIAGINYGLLPSENLITMIAPDYFGNPSTGNFWGYFNYHETVTYAGVIGLVGLIFGLVFFKKLKVGKFFLVASVVALIFQFSTPLGEAVYRFKVPFLWTSVAGRVGMIYLLGVSVLVAEMIENMNSLNWLQKVRLFVPSTLAIVIALGISIFSIRLFSQPDVVSQLLPNIKNLNIGIRNLAIPLLLSGGLFGVFILSKKIKFWKWFVLMIVIADLFRFGWKYTPIVPKLYAYPETEVTKFLKKDTSVFRVDREKAEILPPNTWMAYKLMSPSGYDPMAISSYVKAYSYDLNKEMVPGVSRYSELTVYDAESLGKYNVKYLLAITRDEKADGPGNNINYKINEKEWTRVFKTESVAVLLNTKYKERARIINTDGTDAEGSATITSYESNKVVIKFSNVDGEKLLLTDTYYPGWVATINGKPTKIGNEVSPFRTVDVREIKDGEITFEYKPESFKWGIIISGASFLIWLLWLAVLRKKRV